MKKLILLFLTLLLGVTASWAETYTITFDTNTGTFYDGNDNPVTSGWIKKWVSNEAGKPAVTLTVSANNINAANGRFAPGQSQSSTYSLSVQDGYIITGFSMNCPTSGAEVTVTPAGESATVVSTGGTLVVNSSASSFVYSGSNAGRILAARTGDGGSFTITVEDNEIVSTSISDEAYVNVGEKVSSFTVATDADDNDHWYILTQTRDGESPMCDAGTGNQLRRTATSITPATINGTKAVSNTQYLIRFFDAGGGLYNIQFADGNFITSSLTTSPAKQAAGKYAFYNTNGGSGSYFGWNLNSSTGSRVDNNGPTYTIAFWGSGTISGTSGNNVWYMYPAELQVPSTTYVYEISDESGVVYTSDPISATPGETISTLPSNYQLNYCNYSVTSTTLASGENTVPVTVSYNLPFTTSTTFGGATWYYATLRGKYLRADDSAKDGSGRYATNSTNERTDAYKWAFFGNPYTGIYVMNKNQGDEKYMYKETQIVFSSPADPTVDDKALWAITPNSTGGFTLRSYTGATMYVNDAGNGGNLGFWNSGNGANDAGSNWLVEAVPAEVTVTYDLYVGGEKVNTTDKIAAANSNVEIPPSLVADYSTLAYDITHEGTIGDTDCTINVTATLKDGIVLPAALSNSKKYRLVSARGGLSTYTDAESGTFLASPIKTALSVSAKEFAIINFESKYYLYSVSDEKFVTYQSAEIAPLADMVAGTSDAIAFSQTTNSVYEIRFDNSDSKIVNSSSTYTYGVVINDWGYISSELDEGNQYVIEEVGDFDSVDVLDALDDFFNGPTAFANAIADLKAINWGLTASGNNGKLNYYNFIGDYAVYAGNEMSIIETLESAGYSKDNLAIAQDILANGYALNMPSTGKFYRIQGYSGNYITSNTKGSNASMNGTASANNIVYYNESNNLVFFGSGYGLYKTSEVAPAGSTLNAYTFSEGAQSSHYYIRSNFDGGGQYCYDNTAHANVRLDRNGSPVTSGSYQTDWTLEEITTLPVSISAAGYATLYCPVALAIPTGVTAYIASDEGTYLHLETIDDVIPANTGVILAGDEGSYNFTITTGGSVDGNDLTGTAVAISRPDGSYILATGEYGVGFYADGSQTIPGFKAYLAAGGGSVKAFVFDDNETGINNLNVNGNLNMDKAIYNLAGQRVMKPTKGLYIKNGKKVIIK